jgi:hypothetical protein
MAKTYKAATDYNTRNFERNKKFISFGEYRITLYERSSWYFRVYVKEEGRNYRQSLNTTDPVLARTSCAIGIASAR